MPGDTLVFYTDGLIERRDRALRVGLEALVAASEAVTAVDAAGVGEELLSRLADAPRTTSRSSSCASPTRSGTRPRSC